MISKTRVLVTGGGGFIAPHLITAMPEHWDVVVHQRTQKDTLPRRPGLRAIYGDMSESTLCAELATGVEAVIHLAGVVTGRNVEEIIDSNLVTTRDVLAAMERCKVPKLVFLSTASVWSDKSGCRLDETLEPNPTTLYGNVKLCAERLINASVAEGRIGSAVILRCNNTYGPACTQGVVANFIRRVAASKPVAINGDGKQLREPLYVADLIDVILRSLELSSGAHLFAISGPAVLTIFEMAQTIAKVMRRELRIDWTEDDPERVRHLTIDTSKAYRVLGWIPSFQFDEGIERTVGPLSASITKAVHRI